MTPEDEIRLRLSEHKIKIALTLVREIKQLLNNAVENANDCIADHSEVVAAVRFNVSRMN